ncbi:MAG TPA: hypothetical protein PK587_00640 [Syntrophales bacterium]|nr:hypothetical protein [Syntrophales bacterium]
MIKHTFILKEGVWTARGRYFNEKMKPFPLEGKTTVSHAEESWVIDSRMKLLGRKEIEFQNLYRVTPFAPGARTANWESYNPSVGILSGKFIIAGDSIISTCASKNGAYEGVEYLQLHSEGRYFNRGAFLEGMTILSSWEIEMQLLD